MNIRDIIQKYLEARNYDGLYNIPLGCACENDWPCNSPNQDCEPAVLHEATAKDLDEESGYAVGDELYSSVEEKESAAVSHRLGEV